MTIASSPSMRILVVHDSLLDIRQRHAKSAGQDVTTTDDHGPCGECSGADCIGSWYAVQCLVLTPSSTNKMQ